MERWLPAADCLRNLHAVASSRRYDKRARGASGTEIGEHNEGGDAARIQFSDSVPLRLPVALDAEAEAHVE